MEGRRSNVNRLPRKFVPLSRKLSLSAPTLPRVSSSLASLTSLRRKSRNFGCSLEGLKAWHFGGLPDSGEWCEHRELYREDIGEGCSSSTDLSSDGTGSSQRGVQGHRSLLNFRSIRHTDIQVQRHFRPRYRLVGQGDHLACHRRHEGQG